MKTLLFFSTFLFTKGLFSQISYADTDWIIDQTQFMVEGYTDTLQIANQYVKMPFRFQGNTGTHYGILYVRYQGTTITVESYAWNQTPNGPCDCSTRIGLV